MQIDRPISIAVILFIIVALIFFLVMPEYKNFRELQLDLGKKTAEYYAAYDYYSAIDKIYQDLQNKEEQLKKIDDALPTNSDTGKIMFFFNQTAAENGIMIRNLFLSRSSSGQKNATESSVKTVKEITFSMDVLGDYESLKKFIMALEKSSRIFEVNNISFSSGNAGSVQIPDVENIQVQQTYNFNLQIKTNSY